MKSQLFTDEGILFISNLKHLEKTYLWNTKVTPAGVAKIQETLQELIVKLGEEAGLTRLGII